MHVICRTGDQPGDIRPILELSSTQIEILTFSTKKIMLSVDITPKCISRKKKCVCVCLRGWGVGGGTFNLIPCELSVREHRKLAVSKYSVVNLDYVGQYLCNESGA